MKLARKNIPKQLRTKTISRCHTPSCACFVRLWKALSVSSITLCLNSLMKSTVRRVAYDQILSSPSSIPPRQGI